MKTLACLLCAIFLATVLPGAADEMPAIFKFDDIVKFDPEIYKKLKLTDEQLEKLMAAHDERKNDPEVEAAEEAFKLARHTPDEEAAKQKWLEMRSKAKERYMEKVAGILTEDQKSLVASAEQLYLSLQREIKDATEGIADKEQRLAKAREIWNRDAASLFEPAQPAAATATPAPAGQ